MCVLPDHPGQLHPCMAHGCLLLMGDLHEPAYVPFLSERQEVMQQILKSKLCL
jgi:hypothetical protein